MSVENVETYWRALDAANRRDMDALVREFDPDVEWHSAVVGMGAEVYRGAEGVRELFRDGDENLANLVNEVSEVRDLGDRILALGRLRARGQESGVETEVSFNQLVDFKNGKVIRLRTFLDRQEALEAAGLSD
jgi:ketosteroid isomerase-like protein